MFSSFSIYVLSLSCLAIKFCSCLSKCFGFFCDYRLLDFFYGLRLFGFFCVISTDFNLHLRAYLLFGPWQKLVCQVGLSLVEPEPLPLGPPCSITYLCCLNVAFVECSCQFNHKQPTQNFVSDYKINYNNNIHASFY